MAKLIQRSAAAKEKTRSLRSTAISTDHTVQSSSRRATPMTTQSHQWKTVIKREKNSLSGLYASYCL
jgi:hypothetical protein